MEKVAVYQKSTVVSPAPRRAATGEAGGNEAFAGDSIIRLFSTGLLKTSAATQSGLSEGQLPSTLDENDLMEAVSLTEAAARTRNFIAELPEDLIDADLGPDW
jgi:hypothetical protein